MHADGYALPRKKVIGGGLYFSDSLYLIYVCIGDA